MSDPVRVVTNLCELLERLVPSLKAQIPWLRVFVEGVVIDGSILLELALEAGRDLQEARDQLDELLALI